MSANKLPQTNPAAISLKTPDHHSAPRKSILTAKQLFYGSLALGGTGLAISAPHFSHLYIQLTELVAQIQAPYQQWFEQQNTTNPLVLIPLAFGGGLISSISPCILSMLPINLSYIGTLEITSRRAAFAKAGQFVLGVVTIFSLFGLFAALASAVYVDYRGYFNLGVGAMIILMGLSFAGLIRLPLPQMHNSLPIPGPYGVGLTFALISSPCASPILFAIIAAAATGTQLVSVITLVSYGLGYTAIIFFASLYTGLVKQSRKLLGQSEWIIRLGSAALILAGIYYLLTGIHWFF